MSMRNIVGRAVSTLLSIASVWLLWVLLTVDDGVGASPARPPREAAILPENPDVILITVDTLRADRIGAYGYEKAQTPNIDRLAESGVTFLQATVPLPRTTPALASLLTGLEPQHHGSREVWDKVEEGTILAEVLKERGYQTIGISANSAAGSKQGLHKGFDEFVDQREIKKRFKDDHAAAVTSWVLELIDGADPEKPLFLWVHYVDPHWPYEPPRKLWKSQPRAPKCRALERMIKAKELTLGHLTVNWKDTAKESLADCSALYDAEVAFTDSEIGRVMAKLEEVGRWHSAIKVFAADHGENLGEDGYYYNHGPSLADASLRVPLVIAAPSVPIGRRDSGVSRIEDVMPTLLQMLQFPAEAWPEMDGRDLSWRWNRDLEIPKARPLAAVAESGGALHLGAHAFVVSGRNGKEYCVNEARYSLCTREGSTEARFYDRESDPFLETPLDTVPEDVRASLSSGASVWGPETTRSRCVRTPKFKLVAYPELEGGYRNALYDLTRDPGEAEDVISRHPKVAADMQNILDRWGADLPLYEVKERGSEEIEELRSLGYLGQ